MILQAMDSILKESPQVCDQKDIGTAKPHDENRFNRPQDPKTKFYVF